MGTHPRERRSHRWRAFAALLLAACTLIACSGDDAVDHTPTPIGTLATLPAGSPSPGAKVPGPTLAAGERPYITVDMPGDAGIVRVPFAVTGTTSLLPGELAVQAIAPDGRVICEPFAAHSEGSDHWSLAFAFAPPEEETSLTVRAYEISDRPGAEESLAGHVVRLAAEAPPIVITMAVCNRGLAIGSTLEVAGTTVVPDGELTVELRKAFGVPVLVRDVTASGMPPEGGTWRASFELTAGETPPGDYDLVAYTNAGDAFPIGVVP